MDRKEAYAIFASFFKKYIFHFFFYFLFYFVFIYIFYVDVNRLLSSGKCLCGFCIYVFIK